MKLLETSKKKEEERRQKRQKKNTEKENRKINSASPDSINYGGVKYKNDASSNIYTSFFPPFPVLLHNVTTYITISVVNIQFRKKKKRV